MLLPNVWGGGQLFAFSGVDGDTGWPALVAVTLDERIGLDFPGGPRLWLALEARRKLADGTRNAPFSAVRPTVVAGDVIVLEIEAERGIGCRLRIVCTDRAGILGEVTTLAPGVRAYLVLDLARRARDTDRGSAGEVVVAAEGGAVSARWVGAQQQAYALRTPRARFAVALETGAAAAQEALQGTLSSDLDGLCNARLGFFDRLPQLPGAGESLQRAFAKACSVLKVNVESPRGEVAMRHSVPDRALHGQMRPWDSALHALGYVKLDAAVAREILLAQLSRVRDDGLLPHDLTTHEQAESGIAHPPILGWAVTGVHAAQPDLDFLARAYEPLSRHLRWYLANRDHDGDGLLEWAGAEESGMANSPRFDAGVEFAAVDLNAFAASEAEALAGIALALKRPDEARIWGAERERLAAAIEANLWCAEDGIYYDRRPNGEFVRVKTCASFTPLYAGVAAAERAARVVERLSDGSQFWPSFPVPSVALDEPAFGDDAWRGPTWPSYNLLIMRGLRRYGHDDWADALRTRCLEEVARWYEREGAIFECYDPAGRVSPRRLQGKGGGPAARLGGAAVVSDCNSSAAALVALAAEQRET